jgi:hypothetical protein
VKPVEIDTSLVNRRSSQDADSQVSEGEEEGSNEEESTNEEEESASSMTTTQAFEQSLRECQMKLQEAEERARASEMRNAELEAKLREAKLFSCKEREMQSQSSPVVLSERSRSADAKEQFIHKLSGELGAVQKEMDAMRTKYEKKLQKLKSSSTQSRTEMSLALFELRQQQSSLKDENSQLLEQVGQLKKERDMLLSKLEGSKPATEQPLAPEDLTAEEDSRMQLILDLSQQVWRCG